MSIYAQTAEYFSALVTVGQVLNFMNPSVMITTTNSNSFLVYVLNQANFNFNQNNQAALCSNTGCNTIITSSWLYPYQYPTTNTYYVVITCKNVVETCSFFINFNMAGMYLFSLKKTQNYFSEYINNRIYIYFKYLLKVVRHFQKLLLLARHLLLILLVLLYLC